MWYEKCIVLLLVGMIFILGTKKKKIETYYRVLEGFHAVKVIPSLLSAPVSFSHMLQDSHEV